jgi:hypothetical protein
MYLDLVGFSVLRSLQFSSPDSDNPFMIVSTGCLLAFPILWLATLICTIVLWRNLKPPIIVLDCITLGLSAFILIRMLIQMIHFIAPGSVYIDNNRYVIKNAPLARHG